jgi:sugar (pentulose or hexulose) kinase
LTIDNLEHLTGRKINRLHVVGGGGKDKLLNQFTANATGRPVFAGPTECTAIGNILIQSLALGHLKSHAELRSVVRNSFPLVSYQPENESSFAEARKRFAALPVLD